MRKKLRSMTMILLLAINLLGVALITLTSAETLDYKPTPPNTTFSRSDFRSNGDLEGIDATSHYKDLVFEGVQPDTGNAWTVPLIDDYYGGWFYQDFECVLQGEHANIWIGLDPTVWTGDYQDYYDDKGTPEFEDDEWHFMYPWTYDGYEFWPGYHDIIYGNNLTYLMNEFDNNIHETVTDWFGEYADRPGPLNDYKIQILIFNIRDGLFYDPWTAPWFIEGYFWGYASVTNNANVFHMDTYQWYRRLGPDPQPDPRGYLPRPFEYEGTFAHEFQHLINFDVDTDEYSWVDEGCSTLAEYACGYGFSPGQISEYLLYWWDTSLVIWQGYLSNYGAVFLWTFYCYEHYGGKQLIWDLAHDQSNGIEGWSNALEKYTKKSFDEIFQDWAIANYLDDTSFAKGIYGYYELDMPSADTDWWDIPYTIWMWEYYNPGFFDTQVDIYPNMGYNYPYGFSLPYVVNYVEFYDGSPELKVYFDGDDYCGVPAHSGMYEWYSDGTAYSWFRMGQTFDIPETGATLKFWNYFEIEGNWDYGYVEVHDLATDEWYTLPGIGTVSTLPNPQDNPNCPDDVEPSTYSDADRWNAFTGHSPGYYQEVMDLSMFAGSTIELYFTYWTDPYTLELGWYIDDIEIPEIGFFDDVESGEDGWTINTGWYISDGIIMNNFEVSFIETKNLYKKNIHHISQLNVDEVTEEGQELLKVIDTKTVQSYAVMVVANQPGYEHTFGTFYYFIADTQPFLK